MLVGGRRGEAARCEAHGDALVWIPFLYLRRKISVFNFTDTRVLPIQALRCQLCAVTHWTMLPTDISG